MPVSVRVAFLALLCLLIAAPAQAAQLWPLKTGAWMEQDKQDNLGKKWTVRVDVLEEQTLDGKKYFHVREQNYDGEGEVDDFYIRSTETEVYGYNGSGLGETLGFRTGSVGDYWIYDGGTKRKQIEAIELIIIPYGGTYTAYKYKHYNLSTPDKYDLEWVVPGLVWIAKEEDHWVSNPLRIPLNAVLARAGQNPLFNLKTGTRLIYNSSDNTGQTWHMNMEVREQVTLNGKIYTHLRQTNYDPYQNNLQDGFYIRCTDKEVYKDNGNGEDIVFRAADKGTSWSYPANGGTVYVTVEDIVQVGVPLGSSFVAYVHRTYFMPPGGPASPSWYDYVVPGETIVKMVDLWLDDPNRAPLTHVLAQKLLPQDLSPIILLLFE
jgi:hypothetical protein